jgi:hypothetical protein
MTVTATSLRKYRGLEIRPRSGNLNFIDDITATNNQTYGI